MQALSLGQAGSWWGWELTGVGAGWGRLKWNGTDILIRIGLDFLILENQSVD